MGRLRPRLCRAWLLCAVCSIVECVFCPYSCEVHAHPRPHTLHERRGPFQRKASDTCLSLSSAVADARLGARDGTRGRRSAARTPLWLTGCATCVAPPRERVWSAYIFLYIFSQKYSLSTLHYTVVSLLYTPTHAARSARPAAHTAPTAARWVGNSDGVVMGESLCAALRARS